MPTWPHLNIPPIDYQDIIYYAAPKKKEGPKSLDEVDPELMKTFDKLGIPLHERAQLSGMAVDAVMDSVSVKTTFKETLAEKALSSVLSAKLSSIIPIWSRSIWEAWSVIVIISLPH